jgi:hypothetical protein
MAYVPNRVQLPVPVPASQLNCGEYAHKVYLFSLTTKKGNIKYDVGEDFPATVSAQMNSSRGVIDLQLQGRGTINSKLFDTWQNGLRDQLKYMTADVYSKCIKRHGKDNRLLINKSEDFMTAKSYMYTRVHKSQTREVREYKNIRDSILPCDLKVDYDVPLPFHRPCSLGMQCLAEESDCLEFKYTTRCKSVDDFMQFVSEERKTFFAMANLPTGGDVVLGIKED